MPSEGLPKQVEVEIALLGLLKQRQGPVEVAFVYKFLAAEFSLNNEQQNRVNNEGRSEKSVTEKSVTRKIGDSAHINIRNRDIPTSSHSL
jgi:hypothetical protein